MWSISVKVKHFVPFLLLILVNSCHVQQELVKNDTSPNEEKKIVLALDSLLKAGQYVQAERYGRLFLTRYEKSPYVDDVAYRLTYLHVIADPKNPYFDYAQARRSFKTFLQKFPSSQYAFACNNWLKVLYLTSRLQNQVEKLRSDNRKLESELKVKSAEIDRLKSTLRDLEKVIKR